MLNYNTIQDDELYHYGVKGMRWGQHLFGDFKSNLGEISSDLKNKWNSLDSGLGIKNKTYDGFDSYMKKNKTSYNLAKIYSKSKKNYDDFKSNLGEISSDLKNKWNSLDSGDYDLMIRKVNNFTNRFSKSKVDSFTSKYKQSEIDQYIKNNIQRSTEAIGRSFGQDFMYDKNKRTVDTSKRTYRDNDTITAQYLERIKPSSEYLASTENSYKETKRLMEKYNLNSKSWSELLKSEADTIKEQKTIVNDYIDKAISSGSIASALGIGKYDDGISASRSLDSLSRTSYNTLPNSNYYWHPAADRALDGGHVGARVFGPDKKYKKYF